MSQCLSDAAKIAVRHIFLQTLMKRSLLPLHELEGLFDVLDVRDTSERDVLQVLACINLDVSSYGFEVKQVRYKDETYVGFINKEADASSSKATGYRKDGKPDVQMTAFFRALLEAIAVSEAEVPVVCDQDAYYMPIGVAGENSQTEASQAPSPGEASTQNAPSQGERGVLHISLGDRQKALDALVSDGWLSREGEDGVGLGPRSMLELSQMVLQVEGVSAETQAYVNKCTGT